jgi:integrase
MPRRAKSNVKGLTKHHNRSCANRGDLTRCGCAWRAKYKGVRVGLSEWSGQSIDPRSKKHAEAVLTRVRAAVDAETFSPEGEKQSLGSGQRLSDFILEWQTHYAEEYGLTSNSLEPMLGVIDEGVGGFTLEHLAGRPDVVERWLNRMQKERSWTDNNWNRYYELLNSLFNRAIKWKRLKVNPIVSIDKRVGAKKKFEVRMEEGIEDLLIAACEKLNRPQHKPHSKLLTWEKVEEIRNRVAAGESQRAIAGAFGISTGLCCQIVKGDIWNPAKYRTGTKGSEMKRRIYAAFDLGLRANELQSLQLKHIDFKPVRFDLDGETREVFVVALPPQITKGGKSTGEIEYVYVGTDRLKRELTARRFTLKDNPEAYVFGAEDGRPIKSFKKMWRELFKLAELDFGRKKGLVWHTTRHEFISRHAENTGDPVLTQQLARHKDLRTTQGYFHVRESRLLKAAVRLNRKAE